MQAARSFSDDLSYQAYRLLQQGKAAFSLAHKALDLHVAELFGLQLPNLDPNNPSEINCIIERIGTLFSCDWQDAEAGIYPKQLLFENSWRELVRSYPLLIMDRLSSLQRQKQGHFRDFDPAIATEGYPRYYLQNFHYQTDGYLSDRSAELYDIQVDLLFNGTADAMRRRVLAPLKNGIKQAFAAVAPHQIRVLDIACGTGRTLLGIRSALPQASLHGLDLSHPYLRAASQLLQDAPGPVIQLLQGNAEKLPYVDGHFHGITCVFALHELPGPIRQRFLNEMFRTLKPGGTAIVCDAMQQGDAQSLAMLENFPVAMHEPFFVDYIKDDINARFSAAGFESAQMETHLVSKYWIGRKPA